MRKFTFFFSVVIMTAAMTSCNGNPPSNVEVTSIELNPTTLSLDIGEVQPLTATVLPDNATDKLVTWTSGNASVASVANGVVTANAEGTATITAKAGKQTAICEVTVRRFIPAEGVLINGIIWAKYNVGAFRTFAEKPESYGMFYQWNRPTAWAAYNPTGWDSTTPTGTTWETDNDPCPNGWRVPTKAEMESLIDESAVISIWTASGGVNGRRFHDAVTNNTIYLPAAGYRNNTVTGALIGQIGCYWCSTQQDSDYAYRLNFDNYDQMVSVHSMPKSDGYVVRCVKK